jgi:ribosome-associated protein YbcJ (S4-like RNA binding protein)
MKNFRRFSENIVFGKIHSFADSGVAKSRRSSNRIIWNGEHESKRARKVQKAERKSAHDSRIRRAYLRSW